MSASKEIVEIGKSILKGSAVMVGTKRLATYADRAIPAVANKGRRFWDRVKGTKSTGKKKEAEIPEEEDLFKEDSAEEVKPVKPTSYDAEFEDKGSE